MTCFSIQKTLFFAALAGVFLAFAPCAHAQAQSPATETEKTGAAERNKAEEDKTDAPILLELFTTSDCSACVMADRMLYDTIIKDKNVIALSCKITDLSEVQREDDLPEAAQTQKKQKGPMDPCVFRQWAYKTGSTNSEVRITIPTFVFNGYDYASAYDQGHFLGMLNAYHYSARNRALEVFMSWKDKDTITVNLPEDPKAGKEKKSASVWIIRYKDMMVEKIDEGMNKGRVLRFSNIVQDIKHIGKWHSRMRSIDVDVPTPQGGKERGGYVVVVQETMGEPVLAAGRLADYPHPNDKKKPPPAITEAPRTAPTPQTQPGVVPPKL